MYIYCARKRAHKRKELGLESKLVIGHIGRFEEQKNHDFLIDIFYEICKKRDNAVLLLIGDGKLEGKIKFKVNQLGLKKRLSLQVLDQMFRIYFKLWMYWYSLPILKVYLALF